MTDSSDDRAVSEALARFPRVELAADLDALPESERACLEKLVGVCRAMDTIYLRQVWARNGEVLLELARDDSPAGRARLEFFLVNKGPWDRCADDRPFLAGVPPRPPQCNHYPADATREEVEGWLESLGEDERAAARGFYTTIRRDPSGRLIAVPYSVEYQGELAEAAALMREAAALTADAGLRSFLEQRADAFLSNDYFDSEVAWMELDSQIEPTIGPYESYDDQWFNAKAAFEGYLTVRDEAETQRLARLAGELQGLEDNLPMDPAARNPQIGALTPIRVVNLVQTGGDAAQSPMAAAFNLPNDERVMARMGSKSTMLRNVQQAKFAHVLEPIADLVMAPADRSRLAFDALATFIVMHELMHGLGPREVAGGSGETVREALRDVGLTVEEGKADMAGMWAMARLVDQGVLDASLRETMYATYVADCFRAIRFGAEEAHSKATVLELNAFLDAGAVRAGADGRLEVDDALMPAAVEGLLSELLDVQARGDYEAARALLDRAVLRPEISSLRGLLGDVPIDISASFALA